MLLPKQELLERLVMNGDEAKAWDVESKLPEVIDTEKDRELLARHDIDVESVLGRRYYFGRRSGHSLADPHAGCGSGPTAPHDRVGEPASRVACARHRWAHPVTGPRHVIGLPRG